MRKQGKYTVWTLIKKESLENILTLRFVIGFLACNLLLGICTYALVQKFNLEIDEARSSVSEYENLMDDWTVYSQVRPTIIRMPAALTVFGSGSEISWGTRLSINHTRIPVFADDRETHTNLLGFFSGFDFTTVLQIFVSLLAMLFTFDAISGEKERGSLRMILSNDVGRAKVIAAKFVGAMLALAPVILSGFIISLMIFLSFGPVNLSSNDWIRLVVIIFITLLYGALYLAVGLLTSSLTHRSAVSLVVGMIIWIVWAMIIPHTVSFISVGFDFDKDLRELDRNISEVALDYQQRERELVMPIVQNSFHSHMDSIREGRIRFRVLGERCIDRLVANLPRFIDLRYEYASTMFSLENEVFQHRLNRIRLCRALRRISPSSVFTTTIRAFAGTDTSSYLHFLEDARRYRLELIRYIDGKGGYGSRRWLTDQPPDAGYLDIVNRFDSMSQDEMNSYLNSIVGTPEWERIFGLIQKELKSDPRRKLDLNDMPRFEPAPIPISATLEAAQWDLLILVFYFAVALSAAVIRMLFYDVR